MSGEPERYRLAEFVHDSGETGDWIAAVPHGPILQVHGSGAMILAVLEEAHEAGLQLDVHGTLARLREVVDGVPEDATGLVADFLDYLEDVGIVHRAG